MAWLFPSFADVQGSCTPSELYDGKVLARDCDFTLPSGVGARYTFSEWGTQSLGQGHYERKYGESSGRQRGFVTWASALINNRYQTSWMSDRFPYSVTIATTDARSTELAASMLGVRSELETRDVR